MSHASPHGRGLAVDGPKALSRGQVWVHPRKNQRSFTRRGGTCRSWIVSTLGDGWSLSLGGPRSWSTRASPLGPRPGRPARSPAPRATRVVLAVPVAPPGWTVSLEGDADELVCLETPEPFFAIGQLRRLLPGRGRGCRRLPGASRCRPRAVGGRRSRCRGGRSGVPRRPPRPRRARARGRDRTHVVDRRRLAGDRFVDHLAAAPGPAT